MSRKFQKSPRQSKIFVTFFIYSYRRSWFCNLWDDYKTLHVKSFRHIDIESIRFFKNPNRWKTNHQPQQKKKTLSKLRTDINAHLWITWNMCKKQMRWKLHSFITVKTLSSRSRSKAVENCWRSNRNKAEKRYNFFSWRFKARRKNKVDIFKLNKFVSNL